MCEEGDREGEGGRGVGVWVVVVGIVVVGIVVVWVVVVGIVVVLVVVVFYKNNDVLSMVTWRQVHSRYQITITYLLHQCISPITFLFVSFMTVVVPILGYLYLVKQRRICHRFYKIYEKSVHKHCLHARTFFHL